MKSTVSHNEDLIREVVELKEELKSVKARPKNRWAWFSSYELNETLEALNYYRIVTESGKLPIQEEIEDELAKR